jgi:hypothetical protein
MSTVRLYGATSGYVDLAAPDVAPDATLKLPARGFGKALQVVQAAKTDAFSTTSSSYAVVTGLSLTITPAADTHKVLLIATMSLGFNTSTGGTTNSVALFRDSTEIGSGTDGFHYLETSGTSITNKILGASIALLDSPSSAAAITYEVRVKAEGSDTICVNRPGTGTTARIASSQLIAIEIAA